jgi:hypothetical protein
MSKAPSIIAFDVTSSPFREVAEGLVARLNAWLRELPMLKHFASLDGDN